MRIPVGDNTAYIFKLTPHTTMKDKLASYNHLIETFFIVTETLSLIHIYNSQELWAQEAPTHLTEKLYNDYNERQPIWGWRNRCV